MDTRASPTPAASSASRSKPAASSSPATNAHLRQQSGMTQPSASSAGAPASARTPRRVPSNAAASSSKSPTDELKPTRNSSNHSLKTKGSKKIEEAQKASKNDELLQGYKSDFETLRALLTCKICDRLLYEPFTVACGHIYCYSCLSQWFSSNKQKTCPDCRAAVTELPSPTYLVREMIHVFISRVDHLPAGETIEQHKTWQKEEAEIVKKDKENTDQRTGGLFKGVFNRPRQQQQLFAIRDVDDGVDRCPLCGWELEAGECERCGLGFDENGMAIDSSAGAFSDMDETTMDDMELEDYDEGDYPDELDFDAFAEEFGDEYDPGFGDDDRDFAVRRWLARGGPIQPNFPFGAAPRQRAAHSVANSRRRYSESIISGAFTEDMETVEEEDEEDEDSSMNDFIDDGETESGSQVSASTASQTPQPRVNRGFQRHRGRRIVESESSSVSQATEEDEDEEDEGPIRPGRRHRPVQNRTLARANGSRGAASSTSTETSAVHDLEEDTQALLREEGWSPLAHDGPDEMDEDGEESDGGRTTVGWEPTANSNNRVPMTISLTPAADRPAPATARQRGNATGRRHPDGSRGLRRRTSALSVSTVHYEDGEADDDDSEVDRDGDTNMSGSSGIRPRASRTRLRDHNQQPNRLANRVPAVGDNGDLDTDDNSDTSVVPTRRLNGRPREYDPRISLLFANHQVILRELELPEPFRYEPSRATTPIARPRTANRNRNAAPLRVVPPASPASRAFPPNVEARSSAISAAPQMPLSNRRDSADTPSNQSSVATPRSERSASITSRASLPDGVQSDIGVRPDRQSSVDSVNSASTITVASAPEVQASARGIPQSITSGPADVIERPMSRLNAARPPSAAGRRNSGGYAINQGFPLPQNVGLNFAQRTAWQVQNRNPYWNLVPPHQMAPRARASRQTLREQSSTATLRPSNSRRVLRPQGSRTEIREGNVQVQNVRSPPSQFNLRPQPSVRRLNPQTSTRALRAGHGVPTSPAAASTASTVSSRLSEDERRRRVEEVIRSRAEALRTNNPFNNRRPTIVGGNVGGHPPGVGQAVPRPGAAATHFTAGEPSTSPHAQQAQSATAAPTSPTLGRRRSNRSLGGLPPGAFATLQNPGFIRTRSGQIYGGQMEIAAAPTTPTRVSAPVATTNYAT